MRRVFGAAAFVTAVVCWVSSEVAAQERGKATRRPNVLLIVADDLGYADVGCQRLSKDVRTPHIDSIAAAGTRFTNGYVSGVVCSPSRAGFLTGRYQQRFGHEVNPGPREPENFGLPLTEVTLAQALKSAGYATGMAGKWHLGMRPPYHPLRRGFDEFFGFLGGGHDYFDPSLGLGVILRGEQPVDEKEYLTDAFSREAVSFIERHATREQPFFLYLTYNAVHSPMQAPKKYLDRFPKVADEKRRALLAMLSALDDGVGQVLDALRRHKLQDDTLVMFVSDNGGPTGDNGSLNTPLRGQKGAVWEGGVRVPFLVQWKGRLPGGRTNDHPVIALDLFPTALAAAEVAPPEKPKLDGVDLLPYLSGAKTDAPHEALYWRSARQWAVRAGNYKLTHLPQGPAQLFDLSADVGEQKDLAAAQPDVVKRLRAAYDAWNAQNVEQLWKTTGGVAEWRKGGRGGANGATQPIGD